jgi:hypothetical protein
MKKFFATLVMAVTATGAANAGELDLYLSSQSIQAGYSMDTGKIGYGGGNLVFGGFYNTDSDLQGNLGLIVTGTPTSDLPLTYGLGVMGYLTNIDEPSSNVQALTLGGLIKYHIPNRTPMAIGGKLFVAPEVTTFGDGQNFLDGSVDFEVEVLPSATAYVGYRAVRTDLKNYGNYDIEDRFHVGVRLIF